MRLFGIFVCGVLLSVQGFAIKGGTGKNAARQLKQLLRNQPLVEKVAALNGESSLAVNSRNLGKKILTAAAAAGLLFTVSSAANADIEKRSKEIDKKVGTAKVVDFGGGWELDISGTLFGNFADYDNGSKADILNAGIGLDSTLSRHLAELSLSGRIVSNNTKEVGADDYTGTEDYVGRAVLVQGIPVGVDTPAMPLLFVEGGGAQYGKNKRQTDATAGIGVRASADVFGKKMELQLRGGVGALWEGKYDGDDYADLDGDSVASFGATLKTGWVSLGKVLGADEGNILNYVPIIPNAVTSYTQYHPLGDGTFSDPTRRLVSNISIIDSLGVTVEWNKKSGEQAYKAVLARLSYQLF